MPIIDVDLLRPGGFLRRCPDRQSVRQGTLEQGQGDEAKKPTAQGNDSEWSQGEEAPISDSNQETNAQRDLGKHIQAMQYLYNAAKDVLHEPRTLDHYSNADLNADQLGALDVDQVLTRYLAQTVTGRTGHTPRKLNDGFISALRNLLKRSKLVPRNSPMQDPQQNNDPEAQRGKSQQSAGIQARKQDDGGGATDATNDSLLEDPDHRHILVVPQLWLIKIDGTLIPS